MQWRLLFPVCISLAVKTMPAISDALCTLGIVVHGGPTASTARQTDTGSAGPEGWSWAGGGGGGCQDPAFAAWGTRNMAGRRRRRRRIQRRSVWTDWLLCFLGRSVHRREADPAVGVRWVRENRVRLSAGPGWADTRAGGFGVPRSRGLAFRAGFGFPGTRAHAGTEDGETGDEDWWVRASRGWLDAGSAQWSILRWGTGIGHGVSTWRRKGLGFSLGAGEGVVPQGVRWPFLNAGYHNQRPLGALFTPPLPLWGIGTRTVKLVLRAPLMLLLGSSHPLLLPTLFTRIPAFSPTSPGTWPIQLEMDLD